MQPKAVVLTSHVSVLSSPKRKRVSTSVSQRERVFSLDDGVSLPHKVVRYEVDGANAIYLAPEIPSWLRVTGQQETVLDLLLAGMTLRQAILAVARDSGCDTQIAFHAARDLMHQVERRGFYRQREEAVPDVEGFRLESVHLGITRRCNYRCIHCYVDAGLPLAGEMKQAGWKNLLSDVATIVADPSSLIVTVSGGEPLLRADCLGIAAHCRDLGFRSMLLTNASAVRTVAQAQTIHGLFDRVQVSLDGCTRESFERVRGRGTFSQTMAGLRRLCAAGVRVELAVMVLPDNLDDLEDSLVSLLASLPGQVHDVRLATNVERSGRAKHLGPEYTVFPEQSKHRVNGILEHLRAEGYLILDADNSLPTRKLGCGIGRGFAVDSDGTLFPCSLPYYPLGRYPETEISTLVRRLAALQDQCSLKHLEQCSRCDFRFVCGGGCRLKNHEMTGSLQGVVCTDRFRQDLLREMLLT